MVTDADIVRTFARAPLRTARLKVLAGYGTNTWRTVDRLVDEGALTRLTHGVYTAPPDGRDGRTWKPPLEAAALAVATARFGPRNAALMGLSAARHWAAIPRAIGQATVAVPRGGYAPIAFDAGGYVRFVPRDLGRLNLILERTALGEGLVTTPAQTLFDLLARRTPDDLVKETQGAIRNLMAQADVPEYEQICGAHRANLRARQALYELKERHALG